MQTCYVRLRLWALRRAAARLLVDRLSSNLNSWWPCIAHWLTCHPATRRAKKCQFKRDNCNHEPRYTLLKINSFASLMTWMSTSPLKQIRKTRFSLSLQASACLLLVQDFANTPYTRKGKIKNSYNTYS